MIRAGDAAALRDLAAVTSHALARRVRAALADCDGDDIAARIGLQLVPGAPDARTVLELLPDQLRAGTRAMLGDGRSTWRWLAHAWLRQHGEAYDVSRLTLVSGPWADRCNVEWGAP